MTSRTSDYSPVPVVSPHFCYPHHVDLAIVRKVSPISRVKFVVNDVNGKLMFDVIRSFLSGRRRKVILDAAGNPIVTLQHKIFNAKRWEVFRGESTEEKDLIFSAKSCSTTQSNAELHVLLANNVSGKVCDYTVKGSWPERSCVVYAGDSSSTIVAQVHKKVSPKLIGRDRFTVSVHPNIDHAFIIALIVIFDKITEDPDGNGEDGDDASDPDGGDGGHDAGHAHDGGHAGHGHHVDHGGHGHHVDHGGHGGDGGYAGC